MSLIFLWSCSSSRYSGVVKVSNYYSIEDELPPEYKLYLEEDSAYLFFKIPATTISNDRSGGARLRVGFYTNVTKKVLIDSLGFNIVVDEGEIRAGQTVVGVVGVKFHPAFNQSFVAEVYPRDFNSTLPKKILFIDSLKNESSRYLIKDANNKALFGHYVVPDKEYRVSSDLFLGDSIVKWTYPVPQALPKPPFANYVPAPSDLIGGDREVLLRESDGFPFTCAKNTFVVLQSLTDLSHYTVAYCFDESFPQVERSDVMIDALRYITTEEEYEMVEGSEDPIQAINDFWLLCSGSKERARQLIKTYYGRVAQSNRYFSAHIPGWKSDRGLIYVIFGPPKTIVLSKNKELWNYGSPGSVDSIVFEFVKVNNPYSTNDFRLIRSDTFKSNWYRVVGAWREGKVY